MALLADKKKNKKSGMANLATKKAATFSIFYLNHYMNIIALCLSDKRILFFYLTDPD